VQLEWKWKFAGQLIASSDTLVYTKLNPGAKYGLFRQPNTAKHREHWVHMLLRLVDYLCK